LSTTNPTRPDPGSNPDRRCGKPATNRLSYGAAPTLVMSQFSYEHSLSSLLHHITSWTWSGKTDIYFGGVEQFWYQLQLSSSDESVPQLITLQGICDTSVTSDRLHGVLLLSHSFNKEQRYRNNLLRFPCSIILLRTLSPWTMLSSVTSISS
jgi:hypothetical protein